MVYLDETWCNAHDGKDKAWGLKKIRLAVEELLGDQQGLAILSKLSMLKGRFNLIAGHLERGNALLCCMQVAKMAGSLVSIVNMSIH